MNPCVIDRSGLAGALNLAKPQTSCNKLPVITAECWGSIRNKMVGNRTPRAHSLLELQRQSLLLQQDRHGGYGICQRILRR